MTLSALRALMNQATTGIGTSSIIGALGGVATHALTWDQALPVIVAGVVGVVWPERPALAAEAQAVTVQAVAAAPAVSHDATALLEAYRSGMHEGGALARGQAATANAGTTP